jgi:hypothetical protein
MSTKFEGVPVNVPTPPMFAANAMQMIKPFAIPVPEGLSKSLLQ